MDLKLGLNSPEGGRLGAETPPRLLIAKVVGDKAGDGIDKLEASCIVFDKDSNAPSDGDACWFWSRFRPCHAEELPLADPLGLWIGYISGEGRTRLIFVSVARLLRSAGRSACTAGGEVKGAGKLFGTVP